MHQPKPSPHRRTAPATKPPDAKPAAGLATAPLDYKPAVGLGFWRGVRNGLLIYLAVGGVGFVLWRVAGWLMH